MSQWNSCAILPYDATSSGYRPAMITTMRAQNDFRLRYQLAFLLCLLFVPACQTAPDTPSRTGDSVPLLPDSRKFNIDPSGSEIRVLVRRAGPLARFGHNHVLVAPVTGVIHAGETVQDSGFDLAVEAQKFVVDPPVARIAEGKAFATEVSDAARRGTRTNLLGENLLDAERHPRILLQSLALRGPRWNPDVRARLTLRGVEQDVRFPAAVFIQDDALTVIAQFTIRQSEFGIEPFSILGGGLFVQDELAVRVRVVALAE